MDAKKPKNPKPKNIYLPACPGLYMGASTGDGKRRAAIIIAIILGVRLVDEISIYI
jgi:hypothetical protein